MFVFGSSPKALRHPQNSFVAVDELAVDLEADDGLVRRLTASPVLVTGRARRRAASRLAATRIMTASPRAGARTCTPTGSPSRLERERHADTAGWPARLDGMRAQVAQVHLDRVVDLGRRRGTPPTASSASRARRKLR